MALTVLFDFLTAVGVEAGFNLASATLQEELIGKSFKLSFSLLNRRKTEYTKYYACPGFSP